MAVTIAGDARQDRTQPLPSFRSGVDVIQIDATVLDGAGRPVRGMRAANFTLFEDGKPQPIVAFSAVDVPDRVASPVAWMRDVAPDVVSNSVNERRLFVIVMDDAMLPVDAAMASRAKAIGRLLVERLGPSDLTAVLFTSNNSHAQDFTNDRSRLLAAIDGFRPGFRGADMPPPADPDPGNRMLPGRNTDEVAYRASLRTLRKAAEYLADVPQSRKAIVYVGVGVPMDTFNPRSEFDKTLRDDAKDLFRRAERANVNISAIDPAGLGGLDAYFETHKDARPDTRLHRDFLLSLADNTGGRAVVDTNAYADGIAQLVRENGSYYLLGYAPKDPADRRLRSIEVKTNVAGVAVRARRNYATDKPGPVNDKAPPLARAVAGLLPQADIAMVTSVAPFAVPGKPEVALAIITDVRQPAPKERVTEDLELMARAFTPDGDSRGVQRQNARVVLRPGDNDAEFDVLTRLDLKPGRYSVRMAAHSTASGKSGSVYTDVVIPDFARDEVSLSGVVLNAAPGRAAAPRDALAALMPIVPTTLRVFDVHDQVTSFLRVYQGGRRPLVTATLTVRIVDAGDKEVFHSTESIGAERFGVGRGADALRELPLGDCAPGPHLLTFEVRLGNSGASARRDVRFTVR